MYLLKRNLFPAILMVVVIALLGCQSLTAGNVSHDKLAGKLDNYLTRIYAANEPGASVLVMQGDKVLLRKGYGLANMELDVSNKPETVFRLGSITKQFTAVSIMMLLEEKKITLDDEITKFLPDYPTRGTKITVRHLLTHTSGIKSMTSIPNFFNEYNRRDLTASEMIDIFKKEPMDFEPGEKYLYNNSGYYLLGVIIEKASGKTYEQFIRERIFEPLNMTASYYGSHNRIIPNRADGYKKDGDGFINDDFLSMKLPYAAGSLLSTVDDLKKWEMAIRQGKLLSAESWKQVYTRYKLNDGKPVDYGFGWAIDEFWGQRKISHGGGINGFTTHILRLPEKNIFVVVLTNLIVHKPGPSTVANKLAGILVGQYFDIKAKVKLDTKTLDSIVGVYKIDEKTNRNVFREGDKLFTQRSGGRRYEAIPVSETRFFYDRLVSYFDIEKDKDGKVVKIILHRPEGDEVSVKTSDKPDLRKEIKLPEDVLKKYEGVYDIKMLKLTISVKDGNIRMQVEGQPPLAIFPESETVFFSKEFDITIEFKKDKSGVVTGLVFKQGDRDIEGLKIK